MPHLSPFMHVATSSVNRANRCMHQGLSISVAQAAVFIIKYTDFTNEHTVVCPAPVSKI